MAQTAVTRERLFALRETIAKLEGKPVPALAAAEQEALGAGNAPRKRGKAPQFSFGVPQLDEALGEDRAVPHGDDGDQQERKQAQDLADPAGGKASGNASLGERRFGEL